MSREAAGATLEGGCVVHINNTITIEQMAGEDPQALAECVVRESERVRALAGREILGDACWAADDPRRVRLQRGFGRPRRNSTSGHVTLGDAGSNRPADLTAVVPEMCPRAWAWAKRPSTTTMGSFPAKASYRSHESPISRARALARGPVDRGQ